MDANLQDLSRLLSMALLIAATIEYAEIVRRRVERRLRARDRRLFAREGLRALVRVFIADEDSGTTAAWRQAALDSPDAGARTA